MFAIQDKVIALGAKKDSGRFAKEDEREAISVFGTAIKEEFVRINTILHGAANKGENVEYDWRTVWVGEPYLSYYVGDDRDDENNSKS